MNARQRRTLRRATPPIVYCILRGLKALPYAHARLARMRRTPRQVLRIHLATDPPTTVVLPLQRLHRTP